MTGDNPLARHGAAINLLTEQALPLFKRHSPGVQSAVLADLMARAMVELRADARADLLMAHGRLIARLVQIYDRRQPGAPETPDGPTSLP